MPHGFLPHLSQRAGERAEQQTSQPGKSRGILRRGLTGALAAAAALSLSFVPHGSPEAQAQSSMGSLSSSAGDLEDLAGIINGILGGLENGGGMALGLGCAAPDLVKGVVGVSGAYYTPTVSNCSAGVVPTMSIHGTGDDIVNYNGGSRHGATYLSINQVHRQFAARNKCDLSKVPSASTKGNTTT